MVRAVRNIEKALSGSGIKEPSASELKNIQITRKSIHTNKPLAKGTVLKKEDLICLRPYIQNSISPQVIEKFYSPSGFDRLFFKLT